MTKDMLWPAAPGSSADIGGGLAGYLRGAALEDLDGRVAPTVSILGAPTKFRDAFETFDTTKRWNAVQVAGGDIVLADGNVAGASYLVLSKDPLTEGTETVIETLDHFVMPVRVATGISMSQRLNGQEFSFELVSTDDWAGCRSPDTGDADRDRLDLSCIDHAHRHHGNAAWAEDRREGLDLRRQ